MRTLGADTEAGDEMTRLTRSLLTAAAVAAYTAAPATTLATAPAKLATKRGSSATRYAAMLAAVAQPGCTLAAVLSTGYTLADLRWDMARGQGPTLAPAKAQ
jgi:hypothetical protein